MSEANRRTVATYNANVEKYIEGTAKVTDGEQQLWLDGILSDLPKSATILEIGSAFGRDADYIESQGYSVKRTDGSVGFVELLQSNGHDAELLNIIERSPVGTYDLVLACAVFLHFESVDFHAALQHVADSLKPAGRFAFSLKHGDGEEWSEQKMDAPRYFNYWREEPLRKELARVGMVASDIRLLAGDKWLHVVAEKP